MSLLGCLWALPAVAASDPYEARVLADKPVAYWQLGETSDNLFKNHSSLDPSLDLDAQGKIRPGEPAQDPEQYPDFSKGHRSVRFGGNGSRLVLQDPGESSSLDFGLGDSLTLEAWVRPDESIPDGQQVYIIGKGRTRPGTHNQNYALRLRGQGGMACVSFLFRNARNRVENNQPVASDWHRWTSRTGLLPDGQWHHVALTFTFGQSGSIRGFIDGEEVKGRWDMGGASDAAPVVDDGELWIGSSLGGSPSSTFHGWINQVALHRKALPARRLKERFRFQPPAPRVNLADLPADRVRVEILENIGKPAQWQFNSAKVTDQYELKGMALAEVPVKYSSRGIRIDRSNPYVIRASARVTLPPGQHRLLLRSLQGSRLVVDGRILIVNPFIKGSGDGHGPVADPPLNHPVGLRYARMGHKDRYATFVSDGKPHVFVLEAVVGGKNLRPDPGEISVSVTQGTGHFHILAPQAVLPHTDVGWNAMVQDQSRMLYERNRKQRLERSTGEARYWDQRHQVARDYVKQQAGPAVPEATPSMKAANAVDHFINAGLARVDAAPAPQTRDATFLRRLSLDVVGRVPTEKEWRQFLSGKSLNRSEAIDHYLEQPGWADHWVGYWQDVLAENPGILKPTLNNTGPFRWWILESFRDNKPMDRFVTELVLMEGSVYHGGPAGFRLATQNDVPMADRAQILSQAFLGMNLACARCHDAPYHDFKQKDLFSLAAMLKKEAQKVPASSSIPDDANIKVGRLVEVSLKPGEQVDPAWPFQDLQKALVGLPADLVRNKADSRERLAALMTDPGNPRMARVLVNRLWKRYLGLGLVEPVDDWDLAEPSHPGLLDWLARELIGNGYDLKHVARLILNSHAYQRQAGVHDLKSDEPSDRTFASPVRRRMTAEQLVDSLFTVVGRDMNTELLTLDNDGRRPAKSFLNLGYPRRAWELTGLSNDRDRPALSMPRTQEILDVMIKFGWRESRQNPVSDRDHSPNLLQPATLANGSLGNGRISRLTDDSALTRLCLEKQSLSQLIERVYLRVLSRMPSAEERSLFETHLDPGYQDRLRDADAPPATGPFDPILLVSWSNHLTAKATDIKLEHEERALRGDDPTQRLEPDWRERMEDMVWALINSPEFVFIP